MSSASRRADNFFDLDTDPRADPPTRGDERDQLAAIDGITTEATWRFPAPLASMLRSWVAGYRGEDIAASLTALEKGISRDRRHERRHR